MSRLLSCRQPVRMLLRAAVLVLLVPVLPLAAQVAPDPATEGGAGQQAGLAGTLRLADLFAVLRDEGIANGATMEADMFPSGGGAAWDEALDRIYAQPALLDRFTSALEAELADDPALPEILAFFASDLGSRAVGLEIEARRAFLDKATEDAARVAADRRQTGRDPRHGQLQRFIAAGDLLEMNVAGALSGNLAFLTGLNDSGAMGAGTPQAQLMEQVWGQEAQVRSDTESWLLAYLGLAYAPLSDAELDAYIAFWESPAGQRLNAALFLAFDQVFRQVSRDLGHAAGLAMLGSDI